MMPFIRTPAAGYVDHESGLHGYRGREPMDGLESDPQRNEDESGRVDEAASTPARW